MTVKNDLVRRTFWAAFGTHTFAGIGFFAVLAGITDALIPDSLAPIGGLLLVVAAVVSICYGIMRAWPRPVWQSYDTPNTEIRIVEGDLFAQDGHIVIGMANTFDTEIPNIIDQHGVQGQLLTRVYENDRSELDNALAVALRSATPIGQFDEADQKPGKQVRYEIGTVATISRGVRKLFFCLAYAEMSARCEARGTVDGIWRSLTNLWKEVGARGNGTPVSIAVIGGGQSRISQILPAQDSIRLIALSYIFASRHEKVANRLNIVVQEDVARRLDMLELQSFLRSLK
ncbi:hypothetical protein FHX82_001846 [Amycolatopsis bartoniae]|uniref:Thoeris protein ThsA Macro domain-containing protein n=1 Tax=Amycolatopsis bartoniae TaxID=941986 RepID=A0A8H9IPW6_9PSEU|nr:macro domain-containing protein [Amycolatopsis bartoniae]MBB2934826.1 hypothetical protein [Amycolatopsis bartoniae]TVT03069.1 hypothetical protein FNH07_26150 [Amycolatopsis bartoniae]GHF44500.1 hypothetical protein GCM10017566_16770 [Amycolatopsis bartoniae]